MKQQFQIIASFLYSSLLRSIPTDLYLMSANVSTILIELLSFNEMRQPLIHKQPHHYICFDISHECLNLQMLIFKTQNSRVIFSFCLIDLLFPHGLQCLPSLSCFSIQLSRLHCYIDQNRHDHHLDESIAFLCTSPKLRCDRISLVSFGARHWRAASRNLSHGESRFFKTPSYR